ncbi:myosin-binding protein h [Lynx pardinus]|uniref:Myosin-binding protein h n=1 Tax=Lynx pardinus TaxID=191816 RepID=A0A485N1D7_LYNPA|nr:myosin-binding protein h [Lynx pardinus]
MTEKATSEAPACGPEETASESAKAPRARPSGTGPHTPAATKPAPPNEDIPSALLLLAVEDVSDSSVTVSWEPPERLGRLGLQGYVLELCREGVSSSGAGPPAVLEQPVHIQKMIEAPKIRVPCHLRQTYIRQVGETVSLQIPFQSSGSGRYELTVHLEDSEARAAIDILVRNLGPPSSIRLLDVWGYDVALEWTLPQDPGNTELLGYVVQKADKMIGQWFTVLERYHLTTCTVSDLIVGNAYSFRVFSENLCGLSTLAAVTKEPARIRKADIVAKPKGFVEQDFSEAPSFTQPLADHTSTPG